MFVVSHDIPFSDGEVPIKDVEELSFHPTNIFSGENTGPPSPSRVFDGVI